MRFKDGVCQACPTSSLGWTPSQGTHACYVLGEQGLPDGINPEGRGVGGKRSLT